MSTLKDVIYNILAECYSFAKESYSVKASIRVMDEVNRKLEFLRPALRLFAEDMEKDLRKNDFKGGWLDGELGYYREKALKHLIILKDIDSIKFITITSKKKAIAHCVKSANYSMMLAHNLVEEIKKEMENKGEK